MKKLLMLILIGLLVALGVFIVINGFEVGNVEVLSYSGIQMKNQELDEKIQESSKLAEKDFKQAVSNVQENSKKLEQTKKEYEDMTSFLQEGDTQTSGQIERYEVETLWVKLGKYATSEGAIIKMDIVQGMTPETYNLKFTVNGSYISITDFISDIENDSTLGFKIEEFKMLPSQDNQTSLQATFVCKDIGIKDIDKASNSNMMMDSSIDDMQQENNYNTTNTNTNNTNTTTNTITTNSTNTTANNMNKTQ